MVEQLRLLLDAARWREKLARWREKLARDNDSGWSAERAASDLVSSLESSVAYAEQFEECLSEGNRDGN